MGDDTSNATTPASGDPGQVTPGTPTLEVDAGKVKAMAITAALAFAGLVSGTTTVLGFIRSRDLAGLADWFQSEPAIPYFAALATAITVGASLLRTFRRKALEIYLAYHVKDRIAVVDVKEPPKPPA